MAPGPDGSENVSLQQSRHLLDDSVLEDRLLCTALVSSDATSTGSSEGTVDCVNGSVAGPSGGAIGGVLPTGYQTQLHYQHQQSQQGHQVQQGFQGCVRRKTVLKDGRKPAVASWQRYWLQIWANSLVYFPPKSFKGYVDAVRLQPIDGIISVRFFFFFLSARSVRTSNVNHAKCAHWTAGRHSCSRIRSR